MREDIDVITMEEYEYYYLHEGWKNPIFLKDAYATCRMKEGKGFIFIDHIVEEFGQPDDLVGKIPETTFHELVHLLGWVHSETLIEAISLLVTEYLTPSFYSRKMVRYSSSMRETLLRLKSYLSAITVDINY